jgi:O-antigen ligase
MSGVFKDRYASIISKDTANTATAQGRIAGIWDDFRVGLRNPIFGHGLGTSLEANANFGTSGQLSHNIYTETFQEIGIVGLCVFLSLIYLIFKNFIAEKRDNNYIIAIKRALFIFASMNIFFGLASYGLSSYEWYFIAGLSVIVCEKSERR